MSHAKTRRLVILGDSAFAEVAYEYFTHDSPYEVVAFSVERPFLRRTVLFGLPVVPFESVSEYCDPAHVEFYAAIVYTQLNRLRARMYRAAKSLGFRPASYISSRAFVWPNAKLGEHCFVFEDNTIQPFVTIGDNVVLWSGNHIGHHSTVEDHCFVSSHVVISGFCTVGASTFIGVNTSIANNVTIGADGWLGPGCTIGRNTEPNTIYKAAEAEPAKVSAKRFFKVREGSAG